MARMDAEYIRSWAFLADLMILLRTAPCVLSRRGV
jgi:lipopolysaccharide/colanic/teichoic acid biosynthesis glycosyltransferase